MQDQAAGGSGEEPPRCNAAASDDRRNPIPRGNAVGTLETSRHVSLIGKSGLDRGLDERRPALQQSPDMIQLPHGAEAAGARAEGRAKLPGERPTVETSQALKLIHRAPFGRSGGDDVPNTRQAAEGSVPDVRAVPEAAPTSRFATVATSSIRATSSMSSSKSQTSAARVAGRRAASTTGCPTKGSGLPSQRVLDKPRIDVDDPVAKTLRRCPPRRRASRRDGGCGIGPEGSATARP